MLVLAHAPARARQSPRNADRRILYWAGSPDGEVGGLAGCVINSAGSPVRTSSSSHALVAWFGFPAGNSLRTARRSAARFLISAFLVARAFPTYAVARRAA